MQLKLSATDHCHRRLNRSQGSRHVEEAAPSSVRPCLAGESGTQGSDYSRPPYPRGCSDGLGIGDGGIELGRRAADRRV